MRILLIYNSLSLKAKCGLRLSNIQVSSIPWNQDSTGMPMYQFSSVMFIMD